MQSRKRNSAFLCLMILAGCAAVSNEPTKQIYMQTEDSHPHEVLPGKTSRFPFWPSEQAGFIDVKCTLSGQAVPFEIRLSGITPKAWLSKNTRVVLGADELQIDLEGVVTEPGKPDVYFDFINQSPDQLLWHQCYNN